MTPKKATQTPKTTNKPPESQSSKTDQDPPPHKMLWSQQVELEEEVRFHSSPSSHMPNKMLSLYNNPSDPFKPVKTTQFPTITRC